MGRPRKTPGTQNNLTQAREAALLSVDSKPIDLATLTLPAGKTQAWHGFFHQTIQTMKAMGTDSWTDLPAIIEFCDVWEEVQDLKEGLKGPDGKDEFTDVAANGAAMVSPHYQALLKARQYYHKLLNDFGMTPRGRAYVYDRRKTSESKASALLRKLDED